VTTTAEDEAAAAGWRLGDEPAEEDPLELLEAAMEIGEECWPGEEEAGKSEGAATRSGEISSRVRRLPEDGWACHSASTASAAGSASWFGGG